MEYLRAVFFPRPKAAAGNVGYVSSMYSTPKTVDSLKGKLNLRDIERSKRRLTSSTGNECTVTWEKYLITSSVCTHPGDTGYDIPNLNYAKRISKNELVKRSTLYTELSMLLFIISIKNSKFGVNRIQENINL